MTAEPPTRSVPAPPAFRLPRKRSLRPCHGFLNDLTLATSPPEPQTPGPNFEKIENGSQTFRLGAESEPCTRERRPRPQGCEESSSSHRQGSGKQTPWS